MSTKNLPSIEEFKKTAWNYKENHKITISKALNVIAQDYGFKNYQAIKPKLTKKDYQKEISTLISLLMEEYKNKNSCIREIRIDGLKYKELSKLIDKIDYKTLSLKGYSIVDEEEKLYLYKNTFSNSITREENDNLIVNQTELIIGKKYIIKPDNPRKLKNRDRVCILVELEDDFMPQKAKVQFLDTKRKGNIDLIDLKNI